MRQSQCHAHNDPRRSTAQIGDGIFRESSQSVTKRECASHGRLERCSRFPTTIRAHVERNDRRQRRTQERRQRWLVEGGRQLDREACLARRLASGMRLVYLTSIILDRAHDHFLGPRTGPRPHFTRWPRPAGFYWTSPHGVGSVAANHVANPALRRLPRNKKAPDKSAGALSVKVRR